MDGWRRIEAGGSEGERRCASQRSTTALEATLDEVRRAEVDRVVVGGDVFPGPMDEMLEVFSRVELRI